MLLQKIHLTTFNILILLKPLINSQTLISPCLDWFIYTGENKNGSEWFGTLILHSDTDLFDIWLHLKFDTPFLKLENAFGELVTSNNTDCFIEKPNFQLQANISHRFAFIIKYAPDKPVPKLISIKLNGKLVCPENGGETSLSNICGTLTVSKHHSEAKSVNNELTYEGAFPWHAILYHLKLPYICAAYLITPFYVITLARCIIRPQSPEEMLVLLGRHFSKHTLNQGRQFRNVSKVILHPDYNEKDDLHNIALVKFSFPVNFTDYVRPICLWQGSTSLSSLLNFEGSVIGWGLDTEAKVSQELIQTKMFLVPEEKCKNSLPIFSSDSYCAGFKEGTTACSCNLGSGMMFLKPNFETGREVWQLRGLVSMGVSSKCNTSHYVSFIDTTNYLEWIIKLIE